MTSQTLTIANSPEDAAALEAVEQHHAQLSGALSQRVAALVGAVADHRDPMTARDALVAWCEDELVPHALAEEAALYPAGLVLPETRMLIEAMLAEHGVITGLVDTLRQADPIPAVAAAGALETLFATHLVKENEQLLPVLVAASEVSVAALLEGMHELLGKGEHDHGGETVTGDEAAVTGGHTCGCGGQDEAGFPELDAREVPHAIRHATIFGALDAVEPGSGLVLVAPHDPLPLLAQLERRSPGRFEVSYDERGPEAWRLLLLRN